MSHLKLFQVNLALNLCLSSSVLMIDLFYHLLAPGTSTPETLSSQGQLTTLVKFTRRNPDNRSSIMVLD